MCPAGSAVQARSGPMQASAPTHPLPIELRRGRCLHRPAGTGPPISVGRGALTSPHGRRVNFLCLASQHKRGARRGWRRRVHTKARHEICKNRFAGQKGTGVDGTSAAERIPKPLVLTAFFPPFLSPRKEREPPEARVDTRGAAQGVRIATASVRTGFAMTVSQGVRSNPGSGRPGGHPYTAVTDRSP